MIMTPHYDKFVVRGGGRGGILMRWNKWEFINHRYLGYDHLTFDARVMNIFNYINATFHSLRARVAQ
jgi:hypothetical protein